MCVLWVGWGGGGGGEGEEEEDEEERAGWSAERRAAEELAAALCQRWRAPIDTLSKAGRAFEVRVDGE